MKKPSDLALHLTRRYDSLLAVYRSLSAAGQRGGNHHRWKSGQIGADRELVQTSLAADQAVELLINSTNRGIHRFMNGCFYGKQI